MGSSGTKYVKNITVLIISFWIFGFEINLAVIKKVSLRNDQKKKAKYMKKIMNAEHPFETLVLIKQISKTYFTQEIRIFSHLGQTMWSKFDRNTQLINMTIIFGYQTTPVESNVAGLCQIK